MTSSLLPRAALLGVALTGCVAPDAADDPDLETPAVLQANTYAGCALHEVIPPAQLSASERGAFSSTGRFFVIGTRTAPAGDGLSWLVEVVKATGGHAVLNYVRGTLEGTRDGTLDGEPVGAACTFSGMAVKGDVLYAGCYASDGRAALLQVDTANDTVRAGAFSTCNFDPATEPCKPVSIYPNGMAVDAAGRIYASNTQAHGIAGPSVTDYSLTQIELGPESAEPGQLDFTFRAWRKKDLSVDGIAPNGIQIREDVLYYVGGPNMNAVPILPDGSAGRLRVFYRGPLLSMIDDFVIQGDEFVLGRAFPSNLTRLRAPAGAARARELATCELPLLVAASSLTAQPEGEFEGLFPAGSLLVTSFFGGGVYTLSGGP